VVSGRVVEVGMGGSGFRILADEVDGLFVTNPFTEGFSGFDFPEFCPESTEATRA